MEKLSYDEVCKLRQRRWATRGDAEVPAEVEDRGHDPSSDAIGGFYGISWLEVFRDSVTCELYAVQCYDGVNRSKGAYEDE